MRDRSCIRLVRVVGKKNDVFTTVLYVVIQVQSGVRGIYPGLYSVHPEATCPENEYIFYVNQINRFPMLNERHIHFQDLSFTH